MNGPNFSSKLCVLFLTALFCLSAFAVFDNSRTNGGAILSSRGFFGETEKPLDMLVNGTGSAVNDFFGFGVSSAGDINGDGCDDLIVGDLGYDYGAMTNPGAACIFFGKADWSGKNLNASNADVIIQGAAAGDEFGYTVACAGDINGDGFSDVIIGAPGYDNGGNANAGRAYIFYGYKSFGSVSIRSAATANETITGLLAGDLLGTSVNGGGT